LSGAQRVANRAISMPSGSGEEVYSATVLPTYQRIAKVAPNTASSAGKNSTQRNAGGLKLSVIADEDLLCDTVVGIRRLRLPISPAFFQADFLKSFLI